MVKLRFHDMGTSGVVAVHHAETRRWTQRSDQLHESFECCMGSPSTRNWQDLAMLQAQYGLDAQQTTQERLRTTNPSAPLQIGQRFYFPIFAFPNNCSFILYISS